MSSTLHKELMQMPLLCSSMPLKWLISTFSHIVQGGFSTPLLCGWCLHPTPTFPLVSLGYGLSVKVVFFLTVFHVILLAGSVFLLHGR